MLNIFFIFSIVFCTKSICNNISHCTDCVEATTGSGSYKCTKCAEGYVNGENELDPNKCYSLVVVHIAKMKTFSTPADLLISVVEGTGSDEGKLVATVTASDSSSPTEGTDFEYKWYQYDAMTGGTQNVISDKNSNKLDIETDIDKTKGTFITAAAISKDDTKYADSTESTPRINVATTTPADLLISVVEGTGSDEGKLVATVTASDSSSPTKGTDFEYKWYQYDAMTGGTQNVISDKNSNKLDIETDIDKTKGTFITAAAISKDTTKYTDSTESTPRINIATEIEANFYVKVFNTDGTLEAKLYNEQCTSELAIPSSDLTYQWRATSKKADADAANAPDSTGIDTINGETNTVTLSEQEKAKYSFVFVTYKGNENYIKTPVKSNIIEPSTNVPGIIPITPAPVDLDETTVKVEDGGDYSIINADIENLDQTKTYSVDLSTNPSTKPFEVKNPQNANVQITIPVKQDGVTIHPEKPDTKSTIVCPSDSVLILNKNSGNTDIKAEGKVTLNSDEGDETKTLSINKLIPDFESDEIELASNKNLEVKVLQIFGEKIVSGTSTTGNDKKTTTFDTVNIEQGGGFLPQNLVLKTVNVGVNSVFYFANENNDYSNTDIVVFYNKAQNTENPVIPV